MGFMGRILLHGLRIESIHTDCIFLQGEVASGVGYKGSDIRFGDITGSKRDDYIAIENSSGEIDLWENLCPVTSEEYQDNTSIEVNVGSQRQFPARISSSLSWIWGEMFVDTRKYHLLCQI